MMYSDRFVVAVKVSGQILRENKDTVRLPFGSEYSILVKNLNSVRSQVNVSVDGELAGSNLVVSPNGELELERFIRNENMDAGNRFKFIERTKTIEGHRGVKSDDGLIRVEYQFERPQPEITERIIRDRYVPAYPTARPPWPRPIHPRRYPMRPGSMRPGSMAMRRQIMGSAARIPRRAMMSRSAPRMDSGRLQNYSGITVGGSESSQRFVYVSGFPLEANSHVIVLRLLGMVGKLPIAKPFTVQDKQACSICGKKNKGHNKCCTECGAALVLI